MLIKEVRAHKIKDSRGEETIEVSVNGQKASSPSGKSKGKYETPSYRISLTQSITNINNLSNKLSRININSFSDLSKLESQIKKQFNLKSAKQFGANALYALESATLKALAKSQKKELWQIINPKARVFPIPLGNAIGGGLHSEKFKIHPQFQEFLLIPKEKSIQKNVKIMKDVYNKLEKQTKARAVNDEGALQTELTDEEVFFTLSKFRKQIRIGTDVASSSFYKNNFYRYKEESLTQEGQIDLVSSLIKRFNIFYVEDALQEEDFQGFTKLLKSNKKTLICGDDLTVTHIDRLNKAIKNKSINAMIIKPNQNGSLLELAEVFKLCKKHKIKTILSHRSGETMDSAIADYAFGFQADFIKTGIATPWRECKLDRLIEIERSLK